MTKEEAIEIIKKYKTESEEDYYVKRAEALDMAIKALEQTDCGKCKYLVYDEMFDEETGDEYNTSYCRKQQPCEDEDSAVKSIAIAFQFGMALGFAKKYDEMDKLMEEAKKVCSPQPKTEDEE